MFSKTVSNYVSLLVENEKKRKEYIILKPNDKDCRITNISKEFWSKANHFWSTCISYRILRLYKIIKTASNALFCNKDMILRNVRVKRERKLAMKLLKEQNELKKKLEEKKLKEQMELVKKEKEKKEQEKIVINVSMPQKVQNTQVENLWRRGMSQNKKSIPSTSNPWNNTRKKW